MSQRTNTTIPFSLGFFAVSSVFVAGATLVARGLVIVLSQYFNF